MHLTQFSSHSVFLSRLRALALSSLILGTIGCSLSSSTPAKVADPVEGSLIMKGAVHGGQQPVANAVIGLYQIGTTGYGLGATSILNIAVKTDAHGGFDLSGTGAFTCPSASTPVYLTATGGDSSGNANPANNNTAIQLVAALGSCGGLVSTTFINVNEVTTAAAAFALGQFYGGFGTTSDSIGAPTTNANGLINAFATAHNVASTSTGLATGTTAATGTNYFMVDADMRKLNTIGNILAACINQLTATSAPCMELFSDVTPTFAPRSTTVAATPPTNTFQAAVYMSLNPTSSNASGSNVATLFADLQPGFMPFAPALSAAPTDWTLALQYTGAGVSNNSAVAIDSNGDVYLANANAAGGLAVLNGGTGMAGGTVGITGGDIGFYSATTNPFSGAAVIPGGVRGVAIDAVNNAFFGSFNANAADGRYYFLRAAATGYNAVYSSSGNAPYAVAIDATNGNAYFTSTSTVGFSLSTTLPVSMTANTSPGQKTAFETGSTTTLALDPGRVLYAPSGTTITENTIGAGTTLTAVAATPGNLFSPYGEAIDHSGRVWIVNSAVNGASLYSLSILSGAGAAGTTTPVASSCLKTPQYDAIDGNNNVWVTNNAVTSGTNYTVCEFDNSGNLISPSIGFGSHGVVSGRGIAVDLSGNVWLTNYTSSAASAQVTQLVGAAVPVVNPISVAAKNNTLGTRP